jgi:cell division control protein 45|eukprot:CAMPEP_0174303696 /NCGR_PEP_ID=MMETSP0809-20121228/60333_1 /TAXON_ID=73025 ORGANISM="Eutreptiella gymnastica-like, Strain CCMP1594" /NCGR_SAMPLE_ID=MMETSP0809 /ASSEMBLY_ACC=CAM_ASM_000658 /LENGTH=596 /DNA_ID=CAMNT_0015409765 /DNA_START=22 /DNA_END=1812 /DNA_ORIENTATION=-
MVWIDVERFREQFENLKADNHENMIGVTVVTGCDCDALAAQRILARIFDRFFVQFKAIPLSSYSILRKLFEKEAEREMSWILLNCGAVEDVRQWMNSENHKVYIIDTQRPIHLGNIDSDKIFVFDDGRSKADYLLKFKDQTKSKARKKRRNVEGADVPEVESDDDLSEDSTSSNDDTQEDKDEEGGRKRKRISKDAEKDYYRGSYYGLSAAVISYMLADQLNVSSDADVLWMAIVGITEQFIFDKIPKDMYRQEIYLFQECVHSRLLNKPTTVTFVDGFVAPKYNESRIVADDEYRFILLRHWSLYDSMWHSQYVASKLGLYQNEKGKQQLDTLLSKVGISPQHRVAAYSALPEADQKSLKTKLEEYGKSYGLRDFTFRSFFKHQGYGFALSAVDLVYGIAAVLEQPTDNEAEFRKHFWAAYEALQSDNMQSVKEGIETAKAQQGALVRQTMMLMVKSGLINCGAFRVGYLGDSTDPTDLAYLVKPVILKRMARFLAEVRQCQVAGKATGRPPQDKPLILAAKNTKTDMWIVVGVQPDKSDGTLDRNKISVAFKFAAMKSRAKCVADGIDPTAIEVHQNSLKPFVDAVLVHMTGAA